MLREVGAKSQLELAAVRAAIMTIGKRHLRPRLDRMAVALPVTNSMKVFHLFASTVETFKGRFFEISGGHGLA